MFALQLPACQFYPRRSPSCFRDMAMFQPGFQPPTLSLKLSVACLGASAPHSNSRCASSAVGRGCQRGRPDLGPEATAGPPIAAVRPRRSLDDNCPARMQSQAQAQPSKSCTIDTKLDLKDDSDFQGLGHGVTMGHDDTDNLSARDTAAEALGATLEPAEALTAIMEHADVAADFTEDAFGVMFESVFVLADNMLPGLTATFAAMKVAVGTRARVLVLFEECVHVMCSTIHDLTSKSS